MFSSLINKIKSDKQTPWLVVVGGVLFLTLFVYRFENPYSTLADLTPPPLPPPFFPTPTPTATPTPTPTPPATSTPTPTPTPTFPLPALIIPGTIEFEDYNNGGEGVAYHDTSVSNIGGAYRTDGVDIKTTADSGSGYSIGWVVSGEWLTYDVDVQATGVYNMDIRYARADAGSTVGHLEVDGIDATGTITFNNTGAWTTYADVVKSISLTAGSHTLKFVADGSNVDFNFMQFDNAPIPTPTISGTPPTPTPSPTSVNSAPTISNVSITSRSSNSVTVDWVTNEPADGQIEYGASPCPCSLNTVLVTAFTTQHSATFSSLSKSTKYYYRIKSKDSSGNLKTSRTYTVRTSSK